MINYKGFDIEIDHDDDADSPRERDNLASMWCWHDRYMLGDWNVTPNSIKKVMRYCQDPGILIRARIEEEKPAIVMPLYLLDHDSLSISTRPYSHFDSGLVGFIFVTKEVVFKEYGWKRITQKRREFLEEILIDEVSEYNQYLGGDIWGFTVTKDDEIVDSCWGFYGFDYCLKEAKSVVDYLARKDEDDKLSKAIVGLVRRCRQNYLNQMTEDLIYES